MKIYLQSGEMYYQLSRKQESRISFTLINYHQLSITIIEK